MSNHNFSLELKKRMPLADWSWLLMSLRQDECVWSALEVTQLGMRAVEELPAKLEAWSPAVLALMADEDPATREAIHLSPFQSVDEDHIQKASRVYEDWAKKPQAPKSLTDAGLLALTFREQYRLSGSWEGTLRVQGIRYQTSKTLLACLYGMVTEPIGLVRALCQSDHPDWVRLGVHALLANPNSPDTQLALLKTLAAELEPSSTLALLQELETHRPQLSALLARQVLANPPASWAAGSGKNQNPEGMDHLEQLIHTLRTAQVYQIAGQADLAVPALADSLRVVRKLRGQISAQLAHSVAQTKDSTADGWNETAREAGLEAWKQAIQLAPDEPRYAAGYAKALIKAGREADAASYLKSIIDAGVNTVHPELVLTFAQVLDRIEEPGDAHKAALKALDLVQHGEKISERESIELVGFLLKNGNMDETLAAIRSVLNQYPSNRDLLALAAKINFMTGSPEKALTSAYAAQAAGTYESAFVEKLGSKSAEQDERVQTVDGSEITSSELKKLVIDSLEGLGSWDAAYSERLSMLAEQTNPSKEDLSALAVCAFSAKKFSKVIEICRKLLQDDPNDLNLHLQVAEAAEALGDFDNAIEHFSRTIQLAPERADFWKGLVRAQSQAGLEASAFETLRAASLTLPRDGEIQLQLGELYLSQGAPTLALPCLRRASVAETSGSEEKIAIRLGETLHQLGRLDEARQVMEPVYGKLSEYVLTSAQSKTDGNGSEKGNPELAHVYARTLLGLGEPEKAIQILTQIVRDQADDPLPCLDLAQALTQLSDQVSGARRAIPFLQRILGISPDGTVGAFSSRLEDAPEARARARALVAEAYAATGEWEKAMDAYRKALEEPANHESAMQTRLSTGLGLTALKLELPEMAVAALQEAAQAEPLNAQIQRNLCEAYLANELSQDAFQAATTALELAPRDIETLVWFIDQGTRIAGLPGPTTQPILSDVIRALRVALQQAPERADLLIRLGRLLIQTGGRSEALDVFRKLVALDTTLQRVSIREVYEAALAVQEAGDARLAVALLRKAISQLEKQEPGFDTGQDSVSLGDLYEALVKALEQLGDLDGALEAIDQALNLDKTRIAFHLAKADLLLKLGRPEKAREILEESLQRWPENVGLRYCMARVCQALNDLPAALKQAELAIAGLDDAQDDSQSRKIYLCAAGLANATLRSRRALAYFQKAISETDPDYNLPEYALRRAELALEAGEQLAAEQAVAIFEGQAASSPRALATCGRVDCWRGDRDDGGKKCRAAVRMWVKLQLGQPGQTPATSKEEFIAELSSIGMAALENRMWQEGFSVFKQMVEMFPEEPQAHYKLAQAMMACAEAQALCQDVDVVKHAPGKDSLLKAADQIFEQCLRTAATKAGNADILKMDGILENWDVEIKRSLGVCARRGRAAFRASLENATALEYLLQTVMPGIEDVAALIMAYRRCGENDRAAKAVQVGWHPVFNGKDCRTDPQVVVQLALAEPDAKRAIELLMDAMAGPECVGSGWPEIPMLQFLVARLSCQAEDYHVANQAIQSALNVWPEEPRWQALAAKIHLQLPSENRLQQMAESITYLEKAAAQEPDNGSHQRNMGEIYLETGQNARALQALELATRLEPSNPTGWLALAKAQNRTGEMDQAAASSERAIDLSEDPVEALILRAEIALQTNNHRGALSRAQSVLRAQPEHPKALYLLARALEGLNRPGEALAVLEKTLPSSENPLEMQLERLQLIKRSQGLEKGLRSLQELVAQYPKQAAFLALLAEWLEEAGKEDAATQAARLALQEGLEGLTIKKRADLHTMIGLHMRRTGQLDQAIQHLSEAIAESSDHLDAYLELGRVYQDRREYQQALKVFQKAINLAGGDYRPYYQAALVLKDNKDYMAAEAMLRRAAQIAPNEVSVHRLLGAVVALNLVHSHRLFPGNPK